jgi:hypothetical protein
VDRARTLVVSLQKSASDSAQRSPSPIRKRSQGRLGDAVNGGQVFGCNRAKSRPALSGRAFLVRSLSLRRYAWRGKPKATKSRSTVSRGAQHLAGRPGANSGSAAPKAPRCLEPRIGCAIAGREAGRRAAHLLSREGVLDREKLRRVTAARWKRSWRCSPNRPVRTAKMRAPVSGRIATGASEARSRVHVGTEEHAPTKLARSAKATGAS